LASKKEINVQIGHVVFEKELQDYFEANSKKYGYRVVKRKGRGFDFLLKKNKHLVKAEVETLAENFLTHKHSYNIDLLIVLSERGKEKISIPTLVINEEDFKKWVGTRQKRVDALSRIFGSNALIEILDFLTLYDGYEYTKTDIIRNTGISRRTLYEVWPVLERFDLVKETKRVGRIVLYTLNMENPIAKKLDELSKEIAIYMGHKIAEKEKAKAEVEVPA